MGESQNEGIIEVLILMKRTFPVNRAEEFFAFAKNNLRVPTKQVSKIRDSCEDFSDQQLELVRLWQEIQDDSSNSARLREIVERYKSGQSFSEDCQPMNRAESFMDPARNRTSELQQPQQRTNEQKPHRKLTIKGGTIRTFASRVNKVNIGMPGNNQCPAENQQDGNMCPSPASDTHRGPSTIDLQDVKVGEMVTDAGTVTIWEQHGSTQNLEQPNDATDINPTLSRHEQESSEIHEDSTGNVDNNAQPICNDCERDKSRYPHGVQDLSTTSEEEQPIAMQPVREDVNPPNEAPMEQVNRGLLENVDTAHRIMITMIVVLLAIMITMMQGGGSS